MELDIAVQVDIDTDIDKLLSSWTDDALQEGAGPEGTRGARVVWVLDGKYLVVSGFER